MTSSRPITASSETRVSVSVSASVSEEGSCSEPGRWADLARNSLIARGVEQGELHLGFVGPTEMTELNTAHMGADGPTDVLAFPLDAVAEEAGPTEVPELLGDVVICAAVAQRNAEQADRSLDDEIALLVVHGVLHILGLDHAEPNERAQMQQAERELLAALYTSESAMSSSPVSTNVEEPHS